MSDPSGAEHRPAAIGGEGEEVDALPVLAGQPAFVRPYPFAGAFSRDWRAAGAVIPAVQAAAVAAGGFVAGAAVVGLVNRRHRNSSVSAKGRRASRAGRARRPARAGERGGELVQIIGSRSAEAEQPPTAAPCAAGALACVSSRACPSPRAASSDRERPLHSPA